VLVFGGPRTLGELATAEQVRPPTMTRIVQGLEASGLVRRARDREDGRVHRLHATAKGRRVMERGRERRVENLATLLGRLSQDDVARVRDAAELVEAALASGSVPALRRPVRRPGRTSGRSGAG
jgi:DNA-binding MarR family transcriptional regulator